MVKRAKNPAQLTEEEKDMIDQIFLILGAAYANITTVNPKDFAEKFISLTKSKKKIVLNYLLLINSRKMVGGQAVAPADLNKELAKTILDNANTQDPTDITTDVAGTAKNIAYINSTDMTKNLHLLQLADIYQNIKGKNEVRRQTRKGQRGRPLKDSDKAYTQPSGMPSVYKITQKVEKLKVLMSKSEASDRIRKALIDSGLVYKYEKFIFQVLYYVIRRDKSAADKLLRLFVSATFVKNSQFETFKENLYLLDECELDQVADKAARISVETHSYDGFLFVGGLFDIMLKVTKNFI